MFSNWKSVKLGNLLIRITNGANVKQFDEKIGLPITRIETIWNEKIDYGRVKYIIENDSTFIEKYKLEDGDILLSHINSDSHLGKTAIYKSNRHTLIHGTNLILLRVGSNILPDYLNYYLKYFKNAGGFYKIAQRSVNQSSVNQQKIKNIEVILTSLPNQHLIVEKIEELFSELDNGVENLKKAQQQLKTYKQAVLKDAFEGKLTKDWREQQTNLSFNELLSISNQTNGILINKSTKNKKEHQVKRKHTQNNKNVFDYPTNLPSSWIWTKFEGIFGDSPQNGLYKPKSDYGSGHKIVRIDNFYDGKMTGSLKKVKLNEDEISKYQIRRNHLLINRVNSLPYLGKCGLVTEKYEGSVFESNIMKIQVNEKIIIPKLLAYYLSSQTGKVQLRKNAKHAVNQASINQTDVANTLIPLTSTKEQAQIIDEIESRLSVVDQLEQTIKENLQKAESLRQSILKKAFSGELLEGK